MILNRLVNNKLCPKSFFFPRGLELLGLFKSTERGREDHQSLGSLFSLVPLTKKVFLLILVILYALNSCLAMEECKSSILELEEQKELIDAAKCILTAIRSNTILTDEARTVLVDLGTQLPSIASSSQKKDENIEELENLLDGVQEKVMSWEAGQFLIRAADSDDTFEYQNAADEAQKLTERLESLSLNKGDDKNDKKIELKRRAHNVLQMAMARLEEEFKYMLSMNKTVFEPEHIMVSFCTEDSLDFWDNSDVSVYRNCLGRVSEEILDFVRIDVTPNLKSIATLMFNSKFDRQCIQAYTSERKNAFDECLFVLKMENLSIEEVHRLDWTSLNSKIKRWTSAVQIFVRVVLASELCLCDQIFGELGPVTLLCFVEASKTSMLQLLDFGEAISVGPHQPERLFRILDMYEALSALLPDIEALSTGEAGSPIIMRYHEVMRKFGDFVRMTFDEFYNMIASNSTNPVLGGGIQPLSKYVMNYITTLTYYDETLNLLFKDQYQERDQHIAPLSPDEKHIRLSPMAHHFTFVVEVLENTLNVKSKLYKNASLQHLFLINNIHYIARKVKSSELRPLFGDKWIREHYWKCHQRALDYERASWSSTLSLLYEKGKQILSSSSTSKILLKERLRSFFLAFEEIYKTQTGWIIPDVELREDLRISISLKAILAYRTLVGRHVSHLSEKHIKYSADDLENYLLDLFEGYQKSLSPCRR